MLFGAVGGDMHADAANADRHGLRSLERTMGAEDAERWTREGVAVVIMWVSYYDLNQKLLKYWAESDPILLDTGPTSFGEKPSTSGA
jgi:hypothetical protein